MNFKIISNSPAETIKRGKKFAKLLSPGDIILFSGELGGGKTTFITGIAKGLGIKQNLSSPSFTIINEYPLGSKKFIHADLYRIDSMDEVNSIGLGDYLYDLKSIICIEWGNKIESYIDRDFCIINFKYNINAEQERNIIFRSSSSYWDKKLRKLEKILKKEYLI